MDIKSATFVFIMKIWNNVALQLSLNIFYNTHVLIKYNYQDNLIS